MNWLKIFKNILEFVKGKINFIYSSNYVLELI